MSTESFAGTPSEDTPLLEVHPIPGQPNYFMLNRATLEEIAARLASERHLRENIIPRLNRDLLQAEADLDQALAIADRRAKDIDVLSRRLRVYRVITIILGGFSALTLTTTLLL